MKLLTKSELKSIAGGEGACDPSFSLAPGKGCTSVTPDNGYVLEVDILSNNTEYLSIWCKGVLQSSLLGQNRDAVVCYLGDALFIYNAAVANSTVKGKVRKVSSLAWG